MMASTPLKHIALRFAVIFFPLFVFLNPNGFIPFTDSLYNWYIQPFHVFIPWVGRSILHLSYPITHFTYGSGDTTYDWLMLLMVLLIGLLGAIAWTIADRRHRRDYNVLYRWLLIIIRYFVAFTMLEYGFGKIFLLQFPFPSLGRLQQNFGSASPMGLAWTFFGYSAGYNYFTGGAEAIAGLLLLFRRTTRIGAILALVIMGNIMAINYAYDVSVKLMSSMLFVMTVVLIARDWLPHCNFLLFNRAADPDNERSPRFVKKSFNISKTVVKYVLITYVIAGNLFQITRYFKQYADYGRPPLFGIYDTKTFIRNMDTLPPLQTDTTRWSRLIVSRPGRSAIKLMNDSLQYYNFTPDTIGRNIIMYTDADTLHKYKLSYTRIGKDSMIIKGSWKGDSVTVIMKRFDESNYVLVSRGFHLVNETPFNR